MTYSAKDAYRDTMAELRVVTREDKSKQADARAQMEAA
jgi:hypothetical protein